MVKRKEEIEKLRKASEMTDKGFAYICENIKPGMTEKEIAKKLDEYMFSLGATGLAFDTIVGSGPNSSMIHSVPTDRKIEEQDIILFDIGYVFNEDFSDKSRTILIVDIIVKEKMNSELI